MQPQFLQSFSIGFRDGGVLVIGAFPFGIAFGVLAGQVGIDPFAAVAMSALVYSGSAQFVALELWSDPLVLFPLWFTAFAMNARYFLYGALLRPRLRGAGPLSAYGGLFFLGDGNWALMMNDSKGRLHDGGYLLGSGLGMYLSWVAGTLVGTLFGPLLAAPERLGLDFLLTAFFATILVSLWRGRGDLMPLVIAIAAALAVDRWVEGPWSILAGGLAGSLFAAVRHRD